MINWNAKRYPLVFSWASSSKRQERKHWKKWREFGIGHEVKCIWEKEQLYYERTATEEVKDVHIFNNESGWKLTRSNCCQTGQSASLSRWDVESWSCPLYEDDKLTTGRQTRIAELGCLTVLVLYSCTYSSKSRNNISQTDFFWPKSQCFSNLFSYNQVRRASARRPHGVWAHWLWMFSFRSSVPIYNLNIWAWPLRNSVPNGYHIWFTCTILDRLKTARVILFSCQRWNFKDHRPFNPFARYSIT